MEDTIMLIVRLLIIVGCAVAYVFVIAVVCALFKRIMKIEDNNEQEHEHINTNSNE